MNAVMTPTGSSIGAMTVRASTSHADEKRRAEERRRRQHEAMVRPDHQPDQMRHDDADEPDGPPTDTAAPVASDALTKAVRWAPTTFKPACRGTFRAETQKVERPREPGKRRERNRRRAAAPSGSADSC